MVNTLDVPGVCDGQSHPAYLDREIRVKEPGGPAAVGMWSRETPANPDENEDKKLQVASTWSSPPQPILDRAKENHGWGKGDRYLVFWQGQGTSYTVLHSDWATLMP